MQKRRGLPRLFHIRPLLHPATFEPGAGDGVRTRDPELGKLVLYQLSYTRTCFRVSVDTALAKTLFFCSLFARNAPKLLPWPGFVAI